MSNTPRPSRDIDGKGRSVRELLAGRKYSIDYYQEESQLPFRTLAEFRKADLDARQVLYQRLAERVWSPERLEEEATS
jgi:hypothetical protein